MKKLKLDIQRFSSTNSTAHYELSQYVGTDKPTYLVDYNQDMSKIDAGIYAADSQATENAASIGTLSNLTTTAKSNLVAAINEVNGETSGIGDLSNLTTTEKTTLVGAINEVDSETAGIGTLANLTTTEKTTLVGAINEVNGNVGTLSNLTTTAKSNVVAAVNEVDGNVGDISTLTTSSKSSVVAAVNEVDSFVDYMTLTDFRQLTNPTITQGGGSITQSNFNIALNSSGTAGKIYGYIFLHGQNNFPRVKYTNTGIQGITDTITITSVGIGAPGNNSVCNITLQIDPPTGTETSASITIRYGNYNNGGDNPCWVFPCLYFFKDFGDVE